MLVGGGARLRPGRRRRPGSSACMPDIAGYVVSPQARGADLLVQPVPELDRRRCRSATSSTSARSSRTPRRPTGSSPATSPPPRSSAEQAEEAVQIARLEEGLQRRLPAAGASDWTPYAQKLKDKGVKGLIWVGEPENLGEAARGAERHRLQARLHPHRRQPLRPEADRHRRRGGQERLRPQRLRPVRERQGRDPRRSSTSTRSRSTSRTARPALPRPAGVVGVAALRPGGEGVRQRPHPQVRVRQRQEDHATGPAAGCTPNGPRHGQGPRVLHRADRDARRVSRSRTT